MFQRTNPTGRSARRGIGTRDLVLIGTTVVLLGVAAIFTCRSGAGETIPPDEAGQKLAFICNACGEHFELTAAEVQAAEAELGPRDPKSMAQGETKGFPCKKCGAWAGHRDWDQP